MTNATVLKPQWLLVAILPLDISPGYVSINVCLNQLADNKDPPGILRPNNNLLASDCMGVHQRYGKAVILRSRCPNTANMRRWTATILDRFEGFAKVFQSLRASLEDQRTKWNNAVFDDGCSEWRLLWDCPKCNLPKGTFNFHSNSALLNFLEEF